MGINLKRSNYAFKYPFERIAAYASGLASTYLNISQVRALDFGFGGGRHLKVLADLGYDVYGIDISEDAIDTTYYNFGKDFIASEKLMRDNILEHKVYPEKYFDVILSVGVLWSLGYEKLIAFMASLIPLMKDDGYLIANFRTKYDDLYSSGEEVSDGGKTVFVPEFQNKWAFLDIDDLKELLCRYGLKIEKLERYERFYNNEQRISYWDILARKSKSF